MCRPETLFCWFCCIQFVTLFANMCPLIKRGPHYSILPLRALLVLIREGWFEDNLFVTKGIETESSAEGCRPFCALCTFDNGHWTTVMCLQWSKYRETEHYVSYICLGTYLRTYVCMFLRTYVCNVCMYVSMYVCVYVCMYACMRVLMHVYMFVCK
jgi:hypothetical protein